MRPTLRKGEMRGELCDLNPGIAASVPAVQSPDARSPRRLHSGLMLAARTALPHFSVSSAMSLPKSAGVPPRTTPLRSAKRALIFGSARAALISLLSLSMISAGVPLGAVMPIHALDSKPGNVSPKAGTSDKASERVVVVTASGRSFPALMCSIDAGKLSNASCT